MQANRSRGSDVQRLFTARLRNPHSQSGARFPVRRNALPLVAEDPGTGIG